MSQGHILVVDDSEMVTQMMRMLLGRLGYAVTLKTSAIDALKWLRVPGNLPDMIMSDVMMPEMDGQEFIRRVRSDPLTTHLPVIMLTAHEDQDKKIEGFEAGADDYLVKPVDPIELNMRVKALLARSQRFVQPRSEAKTITVFSLRGGVGTTSLAVNLSASLAHLWGIEVPLLDMALKNGNCGLFLDTKSKNTISRLVTWDTPTVEPDIIEQLLIKHPSGIKLLAAPLSPAEAELITPEVVDRAWPYLRASYPFLVVDGGSQLSEPTLTLLERSHTILLMLAPELASVKAAVDTMRVFEQLGYDLDRVMPVVNWTFPQYGLPQKNLEAALKHQINTIIPHDSKAFIQAVNSGQPSFITNPTSPSSLAIATLAYDLSTQEMANKEIAQPSKLLSWIRRQSKAA
jgi:pilus assembly protein CpaE